MKLLCADCYVGSHKAPHKKQHLVSLTADPSKICSSYDETLSAIAVQNCKTHTARFIHFMCKTCARELCCDCLLTEDHKGHEIVEFDDAWAELNKRVEKTLILLKAQAEMVGTARNTVLSLKKRCETDNEAIEAEVLSAFKKVETALAEKKAEAVRIIERKRENEKRIIEKREAELGKMVKDTDTSIAAHKKVIQFKTGKAFVEEKGLKYENVGNVVAGVEIPEGKVAELKMMKEVLSAVNAITFECKITFSECSILHLRDCKRLTQQKRKDRNYAFAMFDDFTQKWYESSFYTGDKTLDAYLSLDDLFLNKKASTLKLGEEVNSIYSIVRNGFFYFVKSDKKTVAKVHCETGAPAETFMINSGGSVMTLMCSNILLIKDECGGDIYAVYKEGEIVKVAEFIVEPKMQIGKSYVMNLKDVSLTVIGKIFIFDKHVFIGTYGSKGFEHEFNLISGKWEPSPDIVFPTGGNFGFVQFIPKERAFLANCSSNDLTYYSTL